MKTAVTVLQEMMVKLDEVPDYECVAQSGPQHQIMFEYRCKALGCVMTATARSKKEAKQEVAKLILRRLASDGHDVPPPYGLFGNAASQAKSRFEGTDRLDPSEASPLGPLGPLGPRSYVALLGELCMEFRLPAPEYELVGDTGPPHLRHFTMTARVGDHARAATCTTKKAARQLAAHHLYTYLRENLARATKDFDEEEALARAVEKAMTKSTEVREIMNRPNLDESALSLGREALATGTQLPAEVRLQAAASALGLELEWSQLDCLSGGSVSVVRLTPTEPALAVPGRDRPAAAAAALSYLHTVLS
ncbi:RISC-loading complex subunit tarbp2-like isoform X2 [Achroia grisella]|uniref:RISC-loading complex subunit tarbp2-like isoform X2 n=1 Tax=Achroia grisella TaxID=688607 RepID=UPI0027D298DC|nr:RISC-loading complex subunit tarbp2-like isoform X2 [Achroia grisella]